MRAGGRGADNPKTLYMGLNLNSFFGINCQSVKLNRFIKKLLFVKIPLIATTQLIICRWRLTSFNLQKASLVCLYICILLSGFPNNSGFVYPKKMHIVILYHMGNTFRHNHF